MTKHFKKDQIEFHGEFNNRYGPAINIKVHGSTSSVKLPLCLGGVSTGGGPIEWVMTDSGFTHEWIDRNLSDDDADAYWQFACEDSYEYAKEQAEAIFSDYSINVYTEGRSGGWLRVDGLPDVDEWDAVLVAKWGKFSRICEALVDDIPHQIVTSIYINSYESREDEQHAA